MSSIMPAARPRLTQSALYKQIKDFNIDRERHPLLIVGIRGYYLNTMGVQGANDRSLYDDALFLDSPFGFLAFNGNTDPDGVRRGQGFGSQRGMALLKPGLWHAYRFDFHKGRDFAICQRAAPVTVIRDGINGDYEHTGYFGINIHAGGTTRTGSLGCQTVPPAQWSSFITTARDWAVALWGQARLMQVTLPYLLLENK